MISRWAHKCLLHISVGPEGGEGRAFWAEGTVTTSALGQEGTGQAQGQ